MDDNARAARLENILACVGSSPWLGVLTDEARTLADAFGASLTFLHVRTEHDGTDEEVRERILSTLPEGTQAEVVVRAGRPDQVILDEARKRGAGLVLAGALKEEPILREVVGSIARRLARRSPCSVLLSTRRDEARPYRRIVASVRPREDSGALVEFALTLARAAGTEEVHIVNEYDPYRVKPSETEAGTDADRSEHDRVRAAAERLELNSFLQGFDLDGVRLRTACIAGRHGVEVSRYAEAHRADLLITPAPSRPVRLLDRLLGHPSETLLSSLPCSLVLHGRRRNRSAPR